MTMRPRWVTSCGFLPWKWETLNHRRRWKTPTPAPGTNAAPTKGSAGLASSSPSPHTWRATAQCWQVPASGLPEAGGLNRLLRQFRLENLGHAVVVEVWRLLPRSEDGFRVAAGHRVAVTGPGEHLDVVGHIPEGHDVGGLDSQRLGVLREGDGLVDAGHGHLKHCGARCRVRGADQMGDGRLNFGKEFVRGAFSGYPEELHA